MSTSSLVFQPRNYASKGSSKVFSRTKAERFKGLYLKIVERMESVWRIMIKTAYFIFELSGD